MGRDVDTICERIVLEGLIKDLGSQKCLSPRHFLLSSHAMMEEPNSFPGEDKGESQLGAVYLGAC